MSDQSSLPHNSHYVSPPAPIRAVVWDVIARKAPEELPYLQGAEGISDAIIVRQLERGGRSNRTLGFGSDEVIAALTAVVWLVLNTTAQEIVKTTLIRGVARSKLLLRRISRRPAVATVLPPLTREQLARLRQLIFEEAGRRTELSEDERRAVAEAVCDRLTHGELPPKPPPPSLGPDEVDG